MRCEQCEKVDEYLLIEHKEKVNKLKIEIVNKTKELDDLLNYFEILTGEKYYYSFNNKDYNFPILLNEFVNRIENYCR